MVEASSTFPFQTFKTIQQYALYVAPGQERLTFRAHCPAQEAASITVLSPDRLITRRVEVIGFTEFQIKSPPSSEGAFWTVATTAVPSKPFADLRFYLYDEKFAYLIQMVK